MRWWTWLMRRFRREQPAEERTEKALQQLDQKIEVTEIAKSRAEEVAEITGEYEAFRPMIESKAHNLDYLRAQRDVLLRRRHDAPPEHA